ncbi:MAG: copper chaperone PCu(A)C [Anaerolineae bacterium]|nr:copper chaperone PCu(A)C [Anaerolineae bacterium]
MLRLHRPLLLIVWLLLAALPAQAHAHLQRSSPAAGQQLSAAPAEIRLWFTEALEARHSRITLRDATGATLELPPATVDPADPHQMAVPLGALPDGVYTVVWRALSAADGHLTEGSFPFSIGIGIGVAAGDLAGVASVETLIPPDSALVRWLHFLALALCLGSLAFWHFVWRPARPDQAAPRLRWLIRAGWLCLGLATGLTLLLQTASISGSGLLAAAFDPALAGIVLETRFGQLWLVRVALWLLLLPGVLWLTPARPGLSWLTLSAGGGLLLAHSLFSHASAAPDMAAAVVADWLHLAASSAWAGGLVALAAAWSDLAPAERPQQLGRLTAAFSNYARVLVALLIVTGFYAAWLHIGSPEALLTTFYGQALLVKMALFAPLLLIAAFNFISTQRRLHSDSPRWPRSLRAAVTAEIALISGVLLAAGTLTAGSPARVTLAQRQALATQPAPPALYVMENSDDLHVHLEITPGTVGENTFALSLFNLADGTLIRDAGRIRLRFDNREQNSGQSELRPELQPDGTYSIRGTNLSLPGTWRIRITIQRPGRFDTVVDLTPTVTAPAPLPPPILEAAPPPVERRIALILAGAALLLIGGFGVGWARPRQVLVSGGGLFAAAGCLAGVLCLVSGVAVPVPESAGSSGTFSARDAWALSNAAGQTGAVYLTLENNTDTPRQFINATTLAATAVEIHATRIVDDIARMERLTALDIPAGQRLEIAPGGYHLMLIDLQRELIPGERFPLTLHFADGQSQMLEVQVLARPPARP